MANDTESVDSNGNSSDLRPRRSNRAKGKHTSNQIDESEDNVIVNNVSYKVGDFVYYMDKKQDVYRIGLIEELKFQKRDKLSNKKAEITIKQFYRLDEIPPSVLSNQGEYDTHVMPQNFPDWLRLREIFISDNNLSTSASSLRGLCTVRHFPDLNHAMVLFSSSQANSSGNSKGALSPSSRLDNHSVLIGKEPGSSLPVVPKHRDDNTFFYVFSYNPRGRKLAVTYLEIRVGGAYQAELPELRTATDKATDTNLTRDLEQLLWKPGQIPEDVFNVYHMATISIACFSGFGGGVDDNASVENGRKIASHMLTQQIALDCLHRSQYNMEKAMEIFSVNSLPETNQMPFLWTDEDHTLFDESVKIHGKNFLRIKQDKRNKKSRMVGDFVTFYYFWKKNRPKNRKYTSKKMLRSRIQMQNIDQSENHNGNNDTGNQGKSTENGNGDNKNMSNDKFGDSNMSPGDALVEHCFNCKIPLPKHEKDVDEKISHQISERIRNLCDKCQSYFRRYGYQRPLDIVEKRKGTALGSEDDDEYKDEAMTGFDEEDDDDDGEAEDEDDDEVFGTSTNQNINSPSVASALSGSGTGNIISVKEEEIVNGSMKQNNTSVVGHNTQLNESINNNTLAAINKYDFDQEDENVEEVSSLLKRNHAKHSLMRDNVITNSNSKAFGSQKSAHITNSQLQPKQNSAEVASSTRSNKRCNFSKRSGNATIEQIPINKRRKTDNNTPNNEDGANTRSATSANKNNFISNQKQSVLPHQPTTDTIKQTVSIPQTHLGTPKKFMDKKANSSNNQSNVTSHGSDTNSSSTSTSNDSSSSTSEDVEDLPLSKRTGTHKSGSIPKPDLSKSSRLELPKDGIEPTYNQMITAVPNIPGVCAVTEPETLSSHVNRKTPQISIPVTSTSVSPGIIESIMNKNNPSGHISTSFAGNELSGCNVNNSLLPNMVASSNNNSCSSSSSSQINMKSEPHIGQEDGILNLVKKRPTALEGVGTSGNNNTSCTTNFNMSSASSISGGSNNNLGIVSTSAGSSNSNTNSTDHYWTQRQESPTKLMHYRSGESSHSTGSGGIGENVPSASNLEPRKIINGFTLVRRSKFGLLLRQVKLNNVGTTGTNGSGSNDDNGSNDAGYFCSRLDLQHSRSELTQSELKEREEYHQGYRKQMNSQSSSITVVQSQPQSSCSAIPMQVSESNLSTVVGQQLPPQNTVPSYHPPHQAHHHHHQLHSQHVHQKLPPNANMPPPVLDKSSAVTQNMLKQQHSQSHSTNIPSNQSQISNSRKISNTSNLAVTGNSSRSLSPIQQAASITRPQSIFTSNMMRHNLHNSPIGHPPAPTPQPSVVRPPSIPLNHNLSSIPNNQALSADFVNSSKLANDYLIFQTLSHKQNEELLQKQEMQKMMIQQQQAQQQAAALNFIRQMQMVYPDLSMMAAPTTPHHLAAAVSQQQQQQNLEMHINALLRIMGSAAPSSSTGVGSGTAGATGPVSCSTANTGRPRSAAANTTCPPPQVCQQQQTPQYSQPQQTDPNAAAIAAAAAAANSGDGFDFVRLILEYQQQQQQQQQAMLNVAAAAGWVPPHPSSSIKQQPPPPAWNAAPSNQHAAAAAATLFSQLQQQATPPQPTMKHSVTPSNVPSSSSGGSNNSGGAGGPPPPGTPNSVRNQMDFYQILSMLTHRSSQPR